MPVGPIIRMFFGSTSSRRSAGSCWRRQRFLSAMATARLASFWPTMKRSSSETISRGEKSVISSEAFEHEIRVGIDADIGGDAHGAAHDFLAVELHRQQGASGGERVIAARSDRHRRAVAVALRP